MNIFFFWFGIYKKKEKEQLIVPFLNKNAVF